MTVNMNPDKTRSAFIKKVESISRQNLKDCYQCGKCSAGCPMASHMDILPNQVIRYAQMGMMNELLESQSIWICVSCMTCNSRCPKGVRIAEVFEALRQVLLRRREDHLFTRKLSQKTLSELPPIALIGSLRKLTS